MRTSLFILIVVDTNSILVMHPSYGLAYFEQQEWPKEWKDTAVALARAQWINHYRVEATATDTAADVRSTPSQSHRTHTHVDPRSQHPRRFSIPSM
ncbi:hypothetical protein GGX14DRAFT_378963 [Mycena pura]|uniref:Uncharacterized protein n=1 Tax=Mycena pura TaxID=153505 RepID=A0AAD6UTR6_9AGAR|nr:hypothetical protein GGX14DRAFT_378963 [Mycena pura]